MSTLFERAATSLHVGEVARRIGAVVTSKDNCRAAWEAMTECEDLNWFCLVREGRKLVGYLTLDGEGCLSENIENPVMEFLEVVRPEQIVSFSTPVLDVIPLLVDEFFLFVSTVNQITHVFTYDCLGSQEFQYALFGLAMELEQSLLNRIVVPPDKIIYRLRILNEKRLKRATNLLRRFSRITNPPDEYALYYTSFTDKVTIAVEDEEICDSMPFASEDSARTFLNKVARLRNCVAHGGSILPEIGSPSVFAVFVSEINKLIHHLKSVRDG
jgi:hypothetical protein